MRSLPLLFGALLLATTAKADTFWLSDPEDATRAAAGSAPPSPLRSPTRNLRSR